jgi:hypothetical protein
VLNGIDKRYERSYYHRYGYGLGERGTSAIDS